MTELTDTTRIVRAACDGQEPGIAALVARFSPWLLVQARQRLRTSPLSRHDAEDLVHDVWIAVLPRLGDIEAKSGRRTPVLVRFMARVLLHKLWTLLEREVLERRPAPASKVGKLPAQTERSVSGALQNAAVRERARLIHEAIEELDERERQLVVLRGLEQHSRQEVATILGMEPNTVSVAYRRACDKLRARLEPKLLEDLASE